MPALEWFRHFPEQAVIAHRGASLDAPENTIPAFELAVEQGADAIELDLDTCATGELVVIHDATVDRTTDGSGKVTDLPFEAIRDLDAGSWFDPRFKDVRVPTIEEVFEAVGHKVYINIELKNYATPFDDLATNAALAVQRHGLEDRVLFSSFNPFNFRKIKRVLPESPAGLLTFKGYSSAWFQWLVRAIGPFDSLHPHFEDVTPKLIERHHHKGQPVYAYTINQAQEMLRMLEMGLDGVITDAPQIARDAIRNGVEA